MSGNKLRVAVVQMHVDAGNPDANFERLERKLAEAVSGEEKPELVMLPEMWNTGYALERIEEIADPEGRRTKELLSAFARANGVQVLGGSIAEKRADGVYNTVYVFDEQGELASSYSKIHLFRLMDEEKYLKAGEELGRLEAGGASAGMMICYDIRFPELARKLALDGAQALFVPAQWPNPRLHHWRTLLTARAIENQMFVIACNRCGTSGESSFFGHSLIIDPWGEIIAEAGEEETILRAEIDLTLVDAVRAKIPVFEDRRPSLY
ncbi:carbon-nitrogen family hydrolase [Paenibacillus sacheonensis]|uniref:Carbon-nitrogen family hydrolase n=1 Tax=Paenibacillus sacheonensis TaxID=742054 RepID=A0A7X4YRJ6_9BACL|nr:carbon-nitrogen family hydrolase [Paenibacillus sacheonensis]MBM7563484.1 putative amidohydrolase [Paenibacillus sacheonensis]NBC71218.1 carbon-nitrogen family hydrolase [Paenibacillus sacheonensis]